jgi:membrane-associated phospholipid phosphatase
VNVADDERRPALGEDLGRACHCAELAVPRHGEILNRIIPIRNFEFRSGNYKLRTSRHALRDLAWPTMKRRSRLLLLCLPATLGLALGTASPAQAAPTDVVVTWNLNMLRAFATANVPPPAANRLGAIVQSAVFDAVNGIERRYTPIHVHPAAPEDASPDAAAASAAHEALVKLFPAQTGSLDAELAATVHDPADPGVGWGASVADQIVAWRSSDGFNATPPPYAFSTAAGQWRPTPGGMTGPPRFRTLATTTPFAMTSPSQFRPTGPPALNSVRHAQDVSEVMAMGAANSPQRSAYQTQTAIFWGAGNGTSPVTLWDGVADSLIVRNHFNVMKSAHLLALVNISIADAVISVFEAKNFYNSWRPVTEINLTLDPTWTPLLVTPYFQEYPSAHSGTSSAAAAVLASVFGSTTTFSVNSPAVPDAPRTYTSFSQAVAEVGDARVFAGIHYRSACDDAITMGVEIAAWAEGHVMLPAGD